VGSEAPYSGTSTCPTTGMRTISTRPRRFSSSSATLRKSVTVRSSATASRWSSAQGMNVFGGITRSNAMRWRPSDSW
jgi:hypothetical protein